MYLLSLLENVLVYAFSLCFLFSKKGTNVVLYDCMIFIWLWSLLLYKLMINSMLVKVSEANEKSLICNYSAILLKRKPSDYINLI